MRDNDNDKPAGLKLRAGIWHIDKTVWTADGRRVQLRESTRCRTLEDATVVLEARVAEVARQGELIERERTFAEAAAEYVADVERRGKDPTRALYALRSVMDAIGHLPLSHIHQRTLQPWIDAQQGRRASGTVGHALHVVATVLRYAAMVLRDGNRPWLVIAPPRLRAPDWGTRQPRPITWDEQDRLIAALPAHLVAPVLWAVSTGARQGEVTTLRWDQHRPHAGLPPFSVWWIPPEVRKGAAGLAASQRQGRYIVCNRTARAILSGQQGRDPVWAFPSPRGGHLCRVNDYGWRTATKKAGLAIRFHDLRHTFGSRAADAGIPFDIRKTLLGHEHRDITAHYSAPGLARLLEEAERIARPVAPLRMVANG